MSTYHDTIRALIGGLAGNRYYPNKFPQETGAPTWPAFLGTIIARDNAIDQCGAGEESEEDVTVQIDVYATTYNEADSLAKQVQTALAAADPPWIRQPGGFESPDPDVKVHRISREWVLYQSST